MRFYTQQHAHYCGIDLHARSMYVCILDKNGNVRVHKKLPCERDQLLRTLKPYRRDLVVAVECVFCWYWVADLCAEEGIKLVLGHALYMKAIHAGKSKNDRVDSFKIASLLRGGNLPFGYVYPRQMRATRDLMRRRIERSGGTARARRLFHAAAPQAVRCGTILDGVRRREGEPDA